MNYLLSILVLICSLGAHTSVVRELDYSGPSNYGEASIIINATLDEVWEYNSQNSYARDWSVYFFKIIECPIADCPENANLHSSDIGYTRRSFRNEDETGIFWDETTTKITKTHTRYYKQIRAYNFHGYTNLMNYNQKGEFLVEQFFEKINENSTKLTFRTGIVKRSELESRVNFFYYAGWHLFFRGKTRKNIIHTFQLNLENIRDAIENGDNYERLHPYNSKDDDFN